MPPSVGAHPGSSFTLAYLVRAHIYGVFATLALGMQVVEGECVAVDRMFAHGGLFRTASVARRFLAAAIGAPVAVGSTASEGGAWGAAVLAAYRASGAAVSRGAWFDSVVFAGAEVDVAAVDAAGREGFLVYLERYRAGLAVEAIAVAAPSPAAS